MKKILVITAFLLAGIFNASAQDTTVVIKSTAQCGECKEKIEAALNFEKGVKSSDVNIETKEVTVVYNSQKTDIKKLRTAISKAGYDADDVPADEKAYKRLKPCCTMDGHKDE